MIVFKKSVLATAIVALVYTGQAQNIGKKITINPFNYRIQKDFTGSNGTVVCAHPLAAKVGADILMQGGNAIDAAIATQLVLAVVYPGAGNIGGGGFMVARLGNGKTIALDFRETGPAAATENMYVNKKTGKPNAALSLNGHLASGVPGTVAGIFAEMKYAKLPFKTLIQPAIELAERGFAITEREANNLDSNLKAFEKNNTTLPVFCKKNGWWKAGDTLVQKDLANTLKRIRDNGAKGFYEGETARLIVNEMERGAGIITLADLKNYKAKERITLAFDYKGYHIITMPPPSSGGVLMNQMFKMLEQRPLPQYGFQTAKSVSLITEVERRAYADRAEHLGDPDFYKVPMKTLVSDAYLKERMKDYDSTKASKSIDIKAGMIKESEQTTHISIMDKDGNCVSLTTTLNGGYGSKTVVGGAGFLLNNEMDDFSSQPGVPNMYGAIGGKANAIAPGKRMLSSMTPTIVLKDGKPFMVVGTPGGTTIITSVLQSIINVVDYGMNAHDAVNKPKFHHQWQPDQVDVENDFPAAVKAQLQTMGYKINERGTWSRTELIKSLGGKKFEAAADKRGDDSVEGY
ncbi:MAG: gamma-glutamyltransferase [Chitinophagaceae bacterium]